LYPDVTNPINSNSINNSNGNIRNPLAESGTIDEEEWCFLEDPSSPTVRHQTPQPVTSNIDISETAEDREILSSFLPLLNPDSAHPSSGVDVGHIANHVLTTGIPNEFRAIIWQLLLGYLPSGRASRVHVLKHQRRAYLRLVQLHCSEVKEEDEQVQYIIKMDVERTHPDDFLGLFAHPIIQSSLKRILFIWSKENADISYFQGLGDLLTPFFLVFSVSRFGSLSDFKNGYLDNVPFHSNLMTYLPAIEADAYWCISKVISSLQSTIAFTEGGLHAEEMLQNFKTLMIRINPTLVEHFDKIGLEFVMFSFRWMLCFLSRELSIKNTILLWDNYIAQGSTGFATFHLYVCAAFLQELAPTLLHPPSDLSTCLYHLQQPPSVDWEPSKMQSLINEARRLWAVYP